MKPLHQVRVFLSDKPSRNPYAAKITVTIGSNANLEFAGDVCLLVKESVIVTLQVLHREPRDEILNVTKVQALVEGFATAAEAEQYGLRLSLALLWTAISKQFSMRLDYHTPLPTMVYDRTQHGGMSMSAEGRVYRNLQVADFTKMLNQGLSSTSISTENLLLSMELFTSAHMETTERARFIALVSSLEPLAKAKKLGPQVDTIIKQFGKELSTNEYIDEKTKLSLNGQLQQLRKESIGQAIARVVRQLLPQNKEALQVIQEAYDLRSKILHEGAKPDDLPGSSHLNLIDW